jgi:hypothetical protein
VGTAFRSKERDKTDAWIIDPKAARAGARMSTALCGGLE